MWSGCVIVKGKDSKNKIKKKFDQQTRVPLTSAPKTTSRADKCPQVNFQGGQVPPGQVPVRTSSPNFPPSSKKRSGTCPHGNCCPDNCLVRNIAPRTHSFLPGTCPTGTCPTVTRRIGTCHPGTYHPGEFPALIFAHCLYAPSTCPQPPYYTWQAHPKDT